MFCSKCGTQNDEASTFCSKCGNSLQKEGAASVVQTQPPAIGMTKKKSKKIPIILAVVAVIVVIIIASGSSSDDRYVKMVKEGRMDNYPQKTVGRAFGDFMGNAKWESGRSEEGQRFVNVRGRIMYADKEVEALVQFFVDHDKGRFEYHACEFNGIPQNEVIFWALLEKVYE